MTQLLGVAALLLGAVAAQAQSKPAAPAKADAKPAAAKPAPAKVAAAKSAAPAAGPLDKAKLEAYVRHLLLWGPQINVAVADPSPAPMPGYQEVKITGSFQQVSIDEIFYVSSDGRKIIRGSVYDIGQSPFASELAKLKTDLQPSMGTPGAQVVLVVFSDFQCAYCREEAKQIRENLLKTYPTQVRLYFKDYPLDQLHPWARNAAIAGRCVFRQNPSGFWDYHDWIFDKQAEITVENLKTKITEWGQAKGLDSIQFARCYDTRATEAEVNKNIAEAKALRVTSTPTMFVNGRPVPGSLPWAQLKSIIDWELDYSKKTGESGEQCCTLTLPVPGKK